jgi:hypothetical protein
MALQAGRYAAATDTTERVTAMTAKVVGSLGRTSNRSDPMRRISRRQGGFAVLVYAVSLTAAFLQGWE